MANIRIVTDSTADLPQELVDRYGITVVPLNVIFKDRTYKDGVELDTDRFYELQSKASVLPTTSQPSPGEFVEAYQPLIDEGADIISIHISSLMSGTMQSARLAEDKLKYPKLKVVDSRGVSMLLGSQVLEAARAVEEGRSVPEILELLESFKDRHKIFFVVDTLEYLQRGGRIGKASAILGTLLNVKPVLTIKEGEIFPAEKVRGINKAMDRMIELIKEELGEKTPLRCFVVHGISPEVFQGLQDRAKEELNCVEIFTHRVGAVVGAHVGPGVAGIVAWRDA